MKNDNQKHHQQKKGHSHIKRQEEKCFKKKTLELESSEAVLKAKEQKVLRVTNIVKADTDVLKICFEYLQLFGTGITSIYIYSTFFISWLLKNITPSKIKGIFNRVHEKHEIERKRSLDII